MQQLLQPPEHPLTLPSPLAAARALGTQALPFALAVAATSFQLVLPDCSLVFLLLTTKFMSLSKRDMNQEHLYQDRKDVVPIHFTTPPPQQQSHQHHHGGCGAIEHQQLKCFSDEVDGHGSTKLNGASE